MHLTSYLNIYTIPEIAGNIKNDFSKPSALDLGFSSGQSSQTLTASALEGRSNRDSLDWKGISASDISQRVLSRVNPGSIVLFHNAAENTPAALPSIIEGLIAEGYDLLPISELLLSGDYEIDHTGKQIPIKN